MFNKGTTLVLDFLFFFWFVTFQLEHVSAYSETALDFMSLRGLAKT